jgi:hypothetical protein
LTLILNNLSIIIKTTESSFKMLQEFEKIEKMKGAEGILPQNLSNKLLNDFVEGLIKITEDNAIPKKMFGIENMVVNIHTDTLRSIIFIAKKFKYVDSYKLTYLEFEELFKIIRKRYGLEKYRREANLKIEPMPTLGNILNPIYSPNNDN